MAYATRDGSRSVVYAIDLDGSRKIAMAVRGKGIYTMNADGGGLHLYARVTAVSVASWTGKGWLRPAWVPQRPPS